IPRRRDCSSAQTGMWVRTMHGSPPQTPGVESIPGNASSRSCATRRSSCAFSARLRAGSSFSTWRRALMSHLSLRDFEWWARGDARAAGGNQGRSPRFRSPVKPNRNVYNYGKKAEYADAEAHGGWNVHGGGHPEGDAHPFEGRERRLPVRHRNGGRLSAHAVRSDGRRTTQGRPAVHERVPGDI